jgi:UDP-N-acetylmuramate: L-alanyl-gamma-D-glutamyl-meso-diaminopimelate ligase
MRGGRLLAILEPRSNTMRMGTHRDQLAYSLTAADAVWLYEPDDLSWDLREVSERLSMPAHINNEIEELVDSVVAETRSGDRIVVMSNGSFGGIHEKLLKALHSTELHPMQEQRSADRS